MFVVKNTLMDLHLGAPSHHTSFPPARLYAKTPQHSTQVSWMSLITIDTFLSTGPESLSLGCFKIFGPKPRVPGITDLRGFMMTFLGGPWFHQSRWSMTGFKNPQLETTITITNAISTYKSLELPPSFNSHHQDDCIFAPGRSVDPEFPNLQNPPVAPPGGSQTVFLNETGAVERMAKNYNSKRNNNNSLKW